MGGQACVFYGAVQFSKDVDLALGAEPENYRRVLAALAELNAELNGVPHFDPELLRRGHAVHFRCSAAGVEKLRIDFMTRMRGVPDFALLWERRTVLQDDAGTTFDIMAVSDLVRAKKTQRDKDWPMRRSALSSASTRGVAAAGTFWASGDENPGTFDSARPPVWG